VNLRLADNLALGKTARQITTHVSAAGSAVDGHVAKNEASCTQDNMVNPWWSVDLGQYYHISSVTVTVPDFDQQQDRRNNYCPF